MDFTQSFLQGVQQGQQRASVKKREEQEAEEFDLKKQMLKVEMQKLDIAQKVAARNARKADAKDMADFDVPAGPGGAPPTSVPMEIPAGGYGEAPMTVMAPTRTGAQQNKFAELKEKAKYEAEATAAAAQSRLQAEFNFNQANPTAKIPMVQVMDPDIAKQLNVQVGASVPKSSVDQVQDMLTRNRLEKRGEYTEQYKPVVFTDASGRIISKDAVTGKTLWVSGDGEVRPTDARIASGVRETLTGKADAIQGLSTVETYLKNPEVQKYMGPAGGRLTLAVAALGGTGIPEVVSRAATEIKRLLATQAFAFGGKTLTPTELETYTSLLPQLTDNFPQAVQKWEQARDYLRRSLNNSLAVASGPERVALGQTKSGRRILDLGGWDEDENPNGPNLSKFNAPPKAATTPAAGGLIVVTAPDGSKHTFPDQAAADRFKQLAGIK